MYVTQHFLSLGQSDGIVPFHDIERPLLAIDESSECSRCTTRKTNIATGLVAQETSSVHANAAQQRKITYYNCGQDGHVATKCPEPKCQQANQASTGRQRGGRNRQSGPGRGWGRGRKVQQANQSQAQPDPDTIVHGCSAIVVNLSTTLSSSTYHSVDPSPIHLWAERICTRYVTADCQKSPEEIDSFEPFYVTWCLNIADIFYIKNGIGPS
jgi:hypothetical protein